MVKKTRFYVPDSAQHHTSNQGSVLGACAGTAYEAMFATQRIFNKRCDDPNNWR